MTIEIKPETEQLVREEISSGHFSSVDELIVRGVRALRENARKVVPAAESLRQPKKNLAQFLLESPLPGSGLRLERQKDYPAPVEL
jgi:Arc/MetJ-type ribon-helix-helix transcriptional regulator